MNTNTSSPVSLTLLNDLALYQARGADAATFLHGQLTNDVTGLAADTAALAGYCSPKGRLLATFVYWIGQADGQPVVNLLMKRDLADTVMRRLNMFVLRAKVSLLPIDQRIVGVSVAANGHNNLLPAAVESAASWTCLHAGNGTWIRIPDASAQRWWWIPAVNNEAAAMADDSALQNWQSADILAGLPWIQADTQDTFIPQTLNLDLINGVSFTKGCYPGQEVVARAHYRGTVKRRMFAGCTSTPDTHEPVSAATDIYREGNDSPCGRVANAAVQASQQNVRQLMLMELSLADAQANDLRLGSPQGPAIELLPLPYNVAP